MHAITSDRDRVHTFVFGTRLTNITRHLRHRDVDVALASVTDAVDDWSSGTRIGKCLRDFNADWSRRVLGQGALVLFISDGLDRDEGHGLEFEIERLHKSCRRLVWLNPLLRYERYEAKAAGARSLIRHVDDARTIHNLESMSDLAATLAKEWPKSVEVGRAHQNGSCRMTDQPAQDNWDGVLEDAARWKAAGKGVALATVVSTWGSSPRPVGSQLAVNEDGQFVGSVSGGCIEGAVVTEAIEAIDDGNTRLLEFGVSNSEAWEVGLACGGKVQVFVERLE